MKNLKDKIIGLFAIIGVMVLLMGNNNLQNNNEKYKISPIPLNNGSTNVYLLDTRTGKVWKEYRGKWEEQIESLN